MICFHVAEALDGHAGLLGRLFCNIAEHNSVYRKGVWRQLKQIDHCLWVATNSADGDDAETEGACRGHKHRHCDSGITDRSQYPFKAALEYLLGTGLLYAQAGLVEVYNDRDEHRGLRDPWLATGNFSNACSASRIAHNHERYLMAVGGCRTTTCALDDGSKSFLRDRVGLILAAAVMSLQQTNGFIHWVSSFLSADVFQQTLQTS